MAILPFLIGCSPAPAPPSADTSRRATTSRRCRDDDALDIHFASSPGGVAEIDVAWVRNNACGVRVVDVREADEIVAGGRIEGAEHVPISRLAEAAIAWNPRDPVVLVCRSGRRSARGVLALERLGFDRVASMTGGMIAWSLAGYSVEEVDLPVEAPPMASGPVSAASLEQALRTTPPRHVRAASLLLFGSESCVDGREDHAVLGTPGGDAGELLLALATVEDVTETNLRDAQIAELFDAYMKSFGRFYFHTDEHALVHLHEALALDPRFADVDLEPRAEEVAAFVRHPPPALREALLEHLVAPENVGCGHLRLVLSYPDDYGVRPGLARALGREVFHRFWNEPEVIDFVVLTGDHHEEAVVNVSMRGTVRAFTNVPAIPPRIAGHSVFVNHPEVSAFLRREHAAFLFDELPMLAASGVSAERFEEALADKASLQLGHTVGHLAAELPVFDLHFVDGEATVVPVSVRAEPEPGS
jgi:rhodanese-related sulfurtransferase